MYWLSPSTYRCAPGDTATIRAIAGTGFRGELKPYAPRHTVRFTFEPRQLRIGIWLCARRLHQGRFIWASSGSAPHVTISAEQLQALVIGLPWCRIGAQATIRVA